MDPRSRRKMFAKAGLVPDIPPVAVQRQWAWIDDRIMPDGEPDGSFSSHVQWVNKAASWIGWTGAKCYDAQGRPCRNGGDMARARDEGAFPVVWYFPDRFEAPVIPTKGEMAAMRHLLSSARTTLKEIRLVPGAGKITWRRLEELLGERAFIEDEEEDVRVATYSALEEVHEYAERGKRASYVR